MSRHREKQASGNTEGAVKKEAESSLTPLPEILFQNLMNCILLLSRRFWTIILKPLFLLGIKDTHHFRIMGLSHLLRF